MRVKCKRCSRFLGRSDLEDDEKRPKDVVEVHEAVVRVARPLREGVVLQD